MVAFSSACPFAPPNLSIERTRWGRVFGTAGGSIHRRGHGVYLSPPSGRLFLVAVSCFSTVIYIIITGTMEAQMINPAQHTSSYRERFRTGLILGGILVAIIVSIFLVRDAEAGAASLLPHFATTTKQVVQESTKLGVESATKVIIGLFNF
jgi:hypothetical protein